MYVMSVLTYCSETINAINEVRLGATEIVVPTADVVHTLDRSWD